MTRPPRSSAELRRGRSRCIAAIFSTSSHPFHQDRAGWSGSKCSSKSSEHRDGPPDRYFAEGVGQPNPRRETTSGRIRDVFETVLNALVAAVLLIPALPLMAVLAAAVRVFDGAPVIYRGERMGKHQRPFTMYKFRTLPPDAEQVIGGDLMTGQVAMTRLGAFLRETRLDELPQLVNVIRGEMALVGPRPERFEVYAKHCAEIPSYDLRFDVRPGLIGYAQLFTPHSTPKAIRARLDNRFVIHRPGFLRQMLFLASALLVLVGNVCRRVGRRAVAPSSSSTGGEAGHLCALLPIDADSRDAVPVPVPVGRMDRETIELHVQNGWRTNPFERFTLRRTAEGGRELRHAACRGEVRRVHPEADGRSRILIKYKPETPRDQYMLDQYFLMQSVGLPSPRRRRRAFR